MNKPWFPSAFFSSSSLILAKCFRLPPGVDERFASWVNTSYPRSATFSCLGTLERGTWPFLFMVLRSMTKIESMYELTKWNFERQDKFKNSHLPSKIKKVNAFKLAPTKSTIKRPISGHLSDDNLLLTTQMRNVFETSYYPFSP